MSKGYGESDGAVLAEIYHVQDCLAMHELRKTVNNNSSGVCEECDIEIPKLRLKAIPHAKYCVKCQSMIDKKPLLFTCRNNYVP